MSDPNQGVVNTTPTPANAAAVVVEPNVNLQVEPNANAPVEPGVNDRLLMESKKHKDRAQTESKRANDLQAQLDLASADKLKEQGKFKELYEEQKTKYDTLQDTVTRQTIAQALGAEAAKAGSRLPVEKLMALGDPSLLQYDETTGKVLGVEIFVEKVVEAHPFLFEKAQTPNLNPMVPNHKTPVPTGPLTGAEVAKLPKEQKKAVWAAAFEKAGVK